MKEESAQLAITGLKQAGINFIVSLASGSFASLTRAIANDRDFINVPVVNENDAIGICFGAWMAGKKPAFVAQNSGLLMATYALMDSIYFSGAFPLLMVIDHRGGFGDTGGGYWFFGYGFQIPRILENFQIHQRNVTENHKLVTDIVQGQKSAETFGKAVALLLSGEVVS